MLRILPIFALILCLSACGGGGQSNSSNGEWYLTVVNPAEDHLIVTINPIAGGSHTYNLGSKEERILYPGTKRIYIDVPGGHDIGPIDTDLKPVDAKPGEHWKLTWDLTTTPPTYIWTLTVIKAAG